MVVMGLVSFQQKTARTIFFLLCCNMALLNLKLFPKSSKAIRSKIDGKYISYLSLSRSVQSEFYPKKVAPNLCFNRLIGFVSASESSL